MRCYPSHHKQLVVLGDHAQTHIAKTALFAKTIDIESSTLLAAMRETLHQSATAIALKPAAGC